jgi:hypothetical protein
MLPNSGRRLKLRRVARLRDSGDRTARRSPSSESAGSATRGTQISHYKEVRLHLLFAVDYSGKQVIAVPHLLGGPRLGRELPSPFHVAGVTDCRDEDQMRDGLRARGARSHFGASVFSSCHFST